MVLARPQDGDLADPDLSERRCFFTSDWNSISVEVFSELQDTDVMDPASSRQTIPALHLSDELLKKSAGSAWMHHALKELPQCLYQVLSADL